MNRTKVVSLSVAFGVLGLALAACVAEPASEEDMADGTVAETEQDLLPGYWTTYTSDEYAPISCNNGYLVDAMRCTGSNCDNVYVHCGSVGNNIRSISWTSMFSEEGTNYRLCPSNQFFVGVACNGGDCDNMALQCASFDSTTRSADCYWSPAFSEEAGYSYLLDNYYAAGLRCTGSRCDNLSIWACRKN